jgi:hypothetical protein
MTKKRDLFKELSEGFDALADQRAGKRTLRTHAVKANPVPKLTAREPSIEIRRPRKRCRSSGSPPRQSGPWHPCKHDRHCSPEGRPPASLS